MSESDRAASGSYESPDEIHRLTAPAATVARRCHLDDCTAEAAYRARLDWTEQPVVLLCVGHAADERQWGSVVLIDRWKAEIESLSLPDLIASFGSCEQGEPDV